MRWNVGTEGGKRVTARILRGFHDVAAARPAWLPKPMILHVIAALWIGVAVLRFVELARG